MPYAVRKTTTKRTVKSLMEMIVEKLYFALSPEKSDLVYNSFCR